MALRTGAAGTWRFYATAGLRGRYAPHATRFSSAPGGALIVAERATRHSNSWEVDLGRILALTSGGCIKWWERDLRWARQHVGAQKAPTGVEQRVKAIIATLQRQIETVNEQLAANAATLDPSLVEHMTEVFQQELGDLQTALIQLPTGSPLMSEVFATGDRVGELITRLQAISAVHGSHASLALSDVEADDKALAFKNAEREAPAGYCDTAPQGKAPCELDATTRDRYRGRILAATTKARENWKNAIASAGIEEKLKTNALTFEQQLGDLLLGVLFNVFAGVAKTVVKNGLDRLDRALTSEKWEEGIGMVRQGIGTDDMKLGRGVIETGIEKTAPVAQAKLKGITAQQLTQQAKQPAPSDRYSFIASMKSLPDKWADTIITNLDQLFDADLAALVNALPVESPSLTPEAFEQRVSDVVTRFQEQVLPIGAISMTPARPVKVVGAHGVKLALVEPEQAPNKDMHGEWKHVAVNTGKFRFVRWIDDDMKDMALGRARQRDFYADIQMKAASDSTFWDSRSLSILALDTSAPPSREASDA